MKRARALLAAVLFAAVGLLASGCVSERALARRIVRAPNQQGVPKVLKQAAAASDRFLSNWRVPVGPPAAELAVAIVEPGDYALKYELKEEIDPKEPNSKRLSLKFEAHMEPKENRPSVAPKGTLILLHGVMMNKESLLMPWGLYFAEKGYRVVLVDLRGHGGSTGDWLGYGAWEAMDLMKVADELQRRGLMTEQVGVFGISYGATMALRWAAEDARVAAVVALAPFSNARQAIVGFARGVMPKLAATISDERFAAAEDRAAGLAGFKWTETDVKGAMPKVKAPVLFFHGRVDTWVSPEHSAELRRLAPPGSRRHVLPDNHMTLTLRLDPIGARALAWFDERLVSTSTETPAGK